MQRVLMRGYIRLSLFIAGGCTLAVAGCSPEARATILGGIESAANTLAAMLVSAFFQTLDTSENSVTSVKAIIEQLPDILA